MSKHEQFAAPPPERVKRIMLEMAAAGAKKAVVGTREKFLAKCGDLPSCRVDMPYKAEDIAELDRRIEDMARRARFLPPCPEAIR